MDIDTPQYVHVHVPSDVPAAWMFSYTQHRDMDNPQDVNADVPLDYFCYWNIYFHITLILMLPSMYMLMYIQLASVTENFITHITAIWTLPSMYTLMYLQMIQ
jgi:hypothetical protein